MTGRERILRTLNRQSVDTIPFDLGGTDCSSIHVIPYAGLRKLMGLPGRAVECGCMTQLIAKFEPDVQAALAVDAEPLFFGSRESRVWKSPFGVDVLIPEACALEELPDGSSAIRNAKGTVASRRAAGAFYFDPVATPLAGIESPAELDRCDAVFERWDYPAFYDEPIEALAERARRQYRSTGRAVVALWRMHYLQAGQLMRGYEQFLVDLMVNPELARALLEKLHRVYMKRVDRFMDAFGDAFDAVFLTDDLGTQQAGLISPAVFKDMIFPHMKELVHRLHRGGKKVILHSCGAVSEFIPAFIEMGVDALNPVQVSAEGMNPRDLVRNYGKDIAFWGGGCDTQHALNAADPAVVRADVRRRLDEFGDNASLVFTQVHNVQYDVPPANILALRDEFWRQTRKD
ncbi:MAG: hypothetical protein HY343_00155 [Lentisphaerae bacterium]|nr:hypothetical protein [Lentisphaerota bacterium]